MRIGLSLAATEPRYNLLAQNIQALFADGSQGWWYDDNDTTTLFQDSAGTTPVTAVEQFVGLQLDKSKGLVLGPELFSNQVGSTVNAAGGAVFTYTSSTQTISVSIAGTSASYPRLRIDLGMITGRFYQVTGRIDGVRTGIDQIRLATSGAANDVPYNSTTGVFSGTVLANAASIEFTLNGTITGGRTIAALSVRELPGNHRYAPASGNRPVWSKRVNLLTKTEQFDDAVWVKSNATVTANATTAPDGTLTADKLIAAATTSSHYLRRDTTFATQAVFSIYAKAAEESVFFIGNATGSSGCLFNLSLVTVTPVVGSTGTITPVGNGWYRCEVTRSEWLDWQYISLRGNQTSYTGDGTSGLFIWGADLRPANQATGTMPLYQRVNTSSDYDTNGFPGYLKADGVDDFLQTNSIDFTATDKITLCAGVRKLSNLDSIVAELSADVNSNNGTFWLASQLSGNFGSASRGTAVASVAQQAQVGGYSAPATAVVSATHNISGDLSVIRANEVAGTNGTGDKGSGNFGNYPAYFFRRGGTTLPFNGYEYGNVAVGKLLTADQLTALETYMNGLTKAY